MASLRTNEHLEPLGHLVEALVAGRAGKAWVHLGVLGDLEFERGLQTSDNRTRLAEARPLAELREEVEMPERMHRLSLRNRSEQGGDLRLAFDIGLGGEVEEAPVVLALSGERFLQILE